MLIVIRGTPNGFDLRLEVRWPALLGFTRNLLITLIAIAAFFSTPVGQGILTALGAAWRSLVA